MIWSGKLIVLVFCCTLSLGCQRQDSQSPELRKGIGAQIELREPITRVSECSTDWAMFMYDLRFSGKSPDRILKPPLKLSWKFKTGGPIYANPIVVAGIMKVQRAALPRLHTNDNDVLHGTAIEIMLQVRSHVPMLVNMGGSTAHALFQHFIASPPGG